MESDPPDMKRIPSAVYGARVTYSHSEMQADTRLSPGKTQFGGQVGEQVPLFRQFRLQSCGCQPDPPTLVEPADEHARRVAA